MLKSKTISTDFLFSFNSIIVQKNKQSSVEIPFANLIDCNDIVVSGIFYLKCSSADAVLAAELYYKDLNNQTELLDVGTTYSDGLYFNVSKILFDKRYLSGTFVIKNISTSTSLLPSAPVFMVIPKTGHSIEIKYHPYNSIYKTKNTFSKSIDNVTGFYFDYVTQDLTLSKTLYKDLLPYDVKLVYSEKRKNERHSFFPNGWKLNLLDYIDLLIVNDTEIDSLSYVDSENIEHEFEEIETDFTNKRYLFSTDGTGLIAFTQFNNAILTMKISSEYSNIEKKFNLLGQILEVRKDDDLYLSYSYSAGQITITDNRNNIITCSYDSDENEISIKLNNSYEYLLKMNSSQELTQISYNNKSNSITYSGGFVSSFSTDSDKEILFSRTNGLISSFELKRANLIREKLDFVYDYLRIISTDYHNVSSFVSIDENLEPISSGELIDDEQNPLVVHANEMLVSDVVSNVLNKKGAVFFDDSLQTAEFSLSSNSDNLNYRTYTELVNLDGTNNDYCFIRGKKYILLAELDRTFTMSMNEDRYIKLELLDNNSSFCELNFDPLNQKQFVSIPFTYPEDANNSVDLSLKVSYKGLKTLGTILIKNVSVVELNGKKETYYASRIGTNNIIGISNTPIQIDGINWYEFSTASDPDGKTYSYSDLVKNFFAVANDTHIFWSNDSHEATYNSASSSASPGGYILRSHRSLKPNYQNVIFAKKTFIKTYIDNSNNEKEIFEFSYVIENGNDFNLVTIKQIGDDIQKTVEKFSNSYSLLQKTTRINNDTDFELVKYGYLERNNTQTRLVKSIEQTTDESTESLYEEMDYDLSNRLISKSNASFNSLLETEYSYLSTYELVDSITDQSSNVEYVNYSSFLDYTSSISKGNSSLSIAYSTDGNTIDITTNDNTFKYSSGVSSSNESKSFYIKDLSNGYNHHVYYSRETSVNGDTYYKIGQNVDDKMKYEYDKYGRFTKSYYYHISDGYYVLEGYQKLASFIYLNEKDNTISGSTSLDSVEQYINQNNIAAYSSAKLYKIFSHVDSTVFDYTYNESGLLTNQLIRNSTNGNNIVSSSYLYDFLDRITELTHSYFNTTHVVSYQYENVFSNRASRIDHYFGTENSCQSVAYDSFHRVSSVTSKTYGQMSNPHRYDIIYSSFSSNKTTNNRNITSNLISKIDYYDDSLNFPNTVYFSYDDNNNITSVYEVILRPYGNDNVYRQIYSYDSINQLVSETNNDLGLNISYSYDNNGNITQVVKTSTSTNNIVSTNTYQYHQYYKDLLISFNNKTINYDYSLNPISYGDDTSFMWNPNHQLKLIEINNDYIEFSYNYDGVRTKKISSISGTHEYILEGHRIIGEKITNNNITHILHYLYGVDGIFGLIYDGSYYYLKKNNFGDVVAIYSNNNIQAKYVYDAYGNHRVLNSSGVEITDLTHIGHINPFRYRGYYYDNDISMYYCVNRYYVPEWGRWLSIDDDRYFDYSKIGGTNLFAYCKNNPIMYVDPEGTISLIFALAIAIVLCAISNVAKTMYKDYEDDGYVNGSIGSMTYLGSAVEGAAIGLAVGLTGYIGGAFLGSFFAGGASFASVLGAFGISSLISFSIGSIGFALNHMISGEEIDVRGALKSGVVLAIANISVFVAGGFSELIEYEGGKIITIGKETINLNEEILKMFVSDVFGNPFGWIIDIFGELLK